MQQFRRCLAGELYLRRPLHFPAHIDFAKKVGVGVAKTSGIPFELGQGIVKVSRENETFLHRPVDGFRTSRFGGLARSHGARLNRPHQTFGDKQ